jgi:hypothetical protein
LLSWVLTPSREPADLQPPRPPFSPFQEGSSFRLWGWSGKLVLQRRVWGVGSLHTAFPSGSQPKLPWPPPEAPDLPRTLSPRTLSPSLDTSWLLRLQCHRFLVSVQSIPTGATVCSQSLVAFGPLMIFHHFVIYQVQISIHTHIDLL